MFGFDETNNALSCGVKLFIRERDIMFQLENYLLYLRTKICFTSSVLKDYACNSMQQYAGYSQTHPDCM